MALIDTLVVERTDPAINLNTAFTGVWRDDAFMADMADVWLGADRKGQIPTFLPPDGDLPDYACDGAESTTDDVDVTLVDYDLVEFSYTKKQCWSAFKDNPFFKNQFRDAQDPRYFSMDGAPNVETLRSRTAQFASFLSQFYGANFTTSVARAILLGDVDADLQSNGGYLKAGTPLVRYNRLNGIWKQIFDDNGVNIKRVAITQNAAATKALQFALTGEQIMAYLVAAMPYIDARWREGVVRADGSREMPQIWMTDWMYMTFKLYLQTAPLTIGGFTAQIISGTGEVMFNGYRVRNLPILDRSIGSPQYPNGEQIVVSGGVTTWYNPHRVFITVPSNIVIPARTNPMQPMFRAEYNPADGDVIFRAQGAFDTKIVNKQFMVALW